MTKPRQSSSLQLLTCGFWCVTLVWLLAADRYRSFLAPGFWPLVAIGAILFAAFGLALWRFPTAGHAAPGGEGLRLAILILPLAFLYAVPAPVAGSYALENRAGLRSLRQAPGAAGGPGQTGAASGDSDVRGAVDATKATPMSLVQLAMEFPENVHQRVSIEGMVYTPQEVPQGCAVLFRFVISCCAADAQPLAILIRGEGAEKLAKDTWVRVEGVIGTTKIEGRDVPTLAVEHLEKIAPPGEPYL
jgi:uncharacterized repeat protein (TIGR03943 family)